MDTSLSQRVDLLLPSVHRKGVGHMTFTEFVLFCTLLVHIIDLIIKINDKKK